MRARYYSPELRRFINADILMSDINNSTTLNRYAYANCNPISNIDPFGLAADESRGGNNNSNWFSNMINDITDWFSKTFGTALLYDNTYGKLTFDNILFGAEYGTSTRYEAGSGKPIEFYYQVIKGSLNQLEPVYGVKINGEDGGFKIGIGSYQISLEASYKNTSFEIFAGTEKAGITINNEVDWKEYTAGSYSQCYIRPITTALIGLISYATGNPVLGFAAVQ